MQASAVAVHHSGGAGRLLALLLLAIVVPLGAYTAANMPVYEAQEVIFVAPAVIIDPNYSHADLRHPGEAQQVRECLDKNPFMNFMIDPHLQRYLRTCVSEDGKIGFQVVDKVRGRFYEKTAYFRRDFKSIADLRDYIRRAAYWRYKGLIQ